MSVQIIIGPAASGKTETCIEKIQKQLTHKPLSRIWVLVPDSQNIVYFRQRLACSGGSIGVRVGTFSSLIKEMLEKHSVFTPAISSALEQCLVAECIDTTYEADLLPYYAAIRHKPGFHEAVSNVISELRSAYISPAQFMQYAQTSTQGKRELALLYQIFVERLDDIDWIDRDGQIWQAITVLQQEPGAAADIDLLIVDGFDAFAGARCHFLKLLSAQVQDMLLTLPGDPDSKRFVHQRAANELEKLAEALAPEVLHTNITPQLSPECAIMERRILEAGDNKPIQASKALFLEVHSQAEEAREALRWIKMLHKREGIPLDTCALFIADLSIYRPLLRAAAKEFGIKVHFSHPEPLTHSPAIQSVLNLLSLPGEDFSSRALFNTLHSPFFDFQLDVKAIGDLETVSRHAHIVQGYEQWEETWARLEKISNAPEGDLDDESRYKNPLAGIDLALLQEQFSQFWILFEDIDEKRTYKDWIIWLENKLQQLQFYDHITEERDQEACHSYSEALKALIVSESVRGKRLIDFQRFVPDLTSTLQSARLDEPRAARQNALYIGKISEARATRYKAVALMGFSEGVFPAVENPDPFLDESTRSELGLEPRLRREQASTFYQAFTRADQRLLLTRTYLGETGETWEPSPYWEAARKLFTQDAVRRISQGLERQQYEAASPQELLFWAVQQAKLNYQEDPALSGDWDNLQDAARVLSARRSKKARGHYEGYTEQIAVKLAEEFSPAHTWSASTFETYGTCPFQFFIQKALELEAKEPPELGLDFAQEGSIMHSILEKLYKQSGKDADMEHMLRLLDTVCEEVFEKAPYEFSFRPSALWQVEQAQLKTILKETIQALEAQRADWSPLAFEAKFGIDGAPILILDTGKESIRLRGLIDRLDINSKGEIRVIDYKRSATNLAAKDFQMGRRLQLPIYTEAAQEALKLGMVKEGIYWIVKDAKPGSLKISDSQSKGTLGLADALGILCAHLDRTLAGIRAGHFPPDTRDADCPSYCAAKQWCWRYHANQF